MLIQNNSSSDEKPKTSKKKNIINTIVANIEDYPNANMYDFKEDNENGLLNVTEIIIKISIYTWLQK